MDGQYRFDFENDSSATGGNGLGSNWQQVPANRWCCDTVDPVEGAFSLHHCFDNTGEGCDFLGLRHDPLNPSDPFSISFRIRHGFDPSSQNNWQIALLAEWDTGEATPGLVPHILSGIVLGVNYVGSDDLVKIWGIEEDGMKELCVTSLNYQEQVGTELAPLFRLEGDGEGRLDLYWSPDPETLLPELLGSCYLEGIPRGRHMILRYRYTASRDMGLWMDRVILDGHFIKDTLAPEVSRVEVVDEKSLLVVFSETVAKPGSTSFRFTPDAQLPGVTPDTLYKSGGGYVLSFQEAIPNRIPQQLLVSQVADPDGNQMRDTLLMVMRNEADWGDLVFNEVMADPDPAVRYENEYLELFNRSDYHLDLEGWWLKVNERSYPLEPSLIDPASSGEFHMGLIPGAYLVVSGLTLPNEGALLSLYSSEGRLVHAVSYKVPWDGAEWKKEGGWSLESPDAEQLCRISSNWEFSNDPGGGTPGRINSKQTILVDRDPPVLLYAGLEGTGTCLLHYSEPIRFVDGVTPSFTLDPGGVEPDSFRILDPLSDVLQLSFPEDFSMWTNYRLSLSGLTDCSGNPAAADEYRAGKVSSPVYGSVVINEIMYDPEEGNPAFVELYLPGEHSYDLQDLSIHLAEEGGSPDKPLPLSSHSRLFIPGQYLVLTECAEQLQEAYQLELSGRWVEVEGLSGIKRSSGIIYLTDRAGNVVDMAAYNNEMHMELLDDPRGISLERVLTERSGMDPENWHSAASMAGYATPGRVNSQSTGISESKKLLEVQPEVFSPDNDGYNDCLNITITTGGHEWVVGLVITDLQGNRVRVLANNHLAAPSVTYIWDGEGENGTIQPMGFYVVHARGYCPASGERWVRRRAVGLVYR